MTNRDGALPTIRQMRSWQRRAQTIDLNAFMLTSDMVNLLGVDHQAGGDSMASQAAAVAAGAKNLVNYLEACISIQKAPPTLSKTEGR